MILFNQNVISVLNGLGDSISRKLESKYVVVSILFTFLLIFFFEQFDYLAHDDLFFKYGESPTYRLAFANYLNARFVPGLVFHALSFVGVELHHIWVALQLFAYLAFAIFAYVFIDKLDTKSNSVEKTICAAIIVLFPYNILYFSNKNNYINAICAIVSVTLAIKFHGNKSFILRYVATTIFLFIAAASYQTTIYYFIVFVCAYQLFHGKTLRATVGDVLPSAITCVIAIGVLLLINHLVLASVLVEMSRIGDPVLIKHFGKPRSAFVDLGGFVFSALNYIRVSFRTLLYPEPILPLVLKIFGAAILLFAYCHWQGRAAGGMEASAHERQVPKQSFIVFLLILLVACLLQFGSSDDLPFLLYLSGAAGAAGVWCALLLLFFFALLPTRRTAALGQHLHAAKLGSHYRIQCFFVIALLLFTASPMQLFIVDSYYPPRILMHVATIWAALLLLAFGSASLEWRRSIGAAAAVFALGVGISTAAMISSINLVHSRDLQASKNIIADLRTQEGFDPGKPVAFAGTIPLNSKYFDNAILYEGMNNSKFNFEWSRRGIIEEATGLRLLRPGAVFQDRARDLCSQIEAPIAHYRTVIVPQGAVVCLLSSMDQTSSM